MTASWFVLCRVVDHYGDAGVCWRLARQLANEHGLDVTLFIDGLATLQRLLPPLDPAQDQQNIDGVTVQRLTDALPPSFSTSSASSASAHWPAVIIDAFGGGLPPTWLAALERDFPPLAAGTALKPDAPRWIVLEYLSAEPWVDTMHGHTSPPPSVGIPRHFFFPGFTEKTGGLLREKHLSEERDAFQRSPNAKRTFLESLDVPVPPPDALLVSLFCYDTPALPALLDAWANGSIPIVGLIPETVAPETVQRWRQRHGTEADAIHTTHGNLTLHTIPFLPQAGFDKLLWSCDLNFVRGEDSFVRAQWTAKPFIWQAYRQEEQAHLVKVEAFLALYLVDAADRLKSVISDLSRAWNDHEQASHIADAWSSFMEQWPELAGLPNRWEHRLSAQTDLASRIVCLL